MCILASKYYGGRWIRPPAGGPPRGSDMPPACHSLPLGFESTLHKDPYQTQDPSVRMGKVDSPACGRARSAGKRAPGTFSDTPPLRIHTSQRPIPSKSTIHRMGEGGFARLRAGHLAALTCRRHVIHSRSASNPRFTKAHTKHKTHPDGWVLCLVGEGGFEPPKALPADLQSVPFGHSGIPPYSVADCQVELVDGFEPPTC